MTDLELLEKAAKAAGMPALVWGEKYMVGGTEADCTDISYVPSDSPDEAPSYWNPLEDDGDALRLAVKLRITLTMFKTIVRAEVDDLPDILESDKPDTYAATRRAIVRAAAAMAGD